MSRVTVSFELDLKDNPSLNISKLEDLRGSLQNLSSLFHELHLHQLQKLTESMCYKGEEVMKQALISCNEQDLAITEQLFHNYTVSGTTDDGHTFESNHQQPGYKETMKIDGKIVDF